MSGVVVGSVNCHGDLLVEEVQRYLLAADIQNILLKMNRLSQSISTINDNLLPVPGESPDEDPRAWFCTDD